LFNAISLFDSVKKSEIMNKDNDRRSRLRLPQVSGVVRETSSSAAAAAAAPPIAFEARKSIVNPTRNAAPKPAAARRFKVCFCFFIWSFLF
jgi:hypothetical protein